jgi:hypothetical protein
VTHYALAVLIAALALSCGRSTAPRGTGRVRVVQTGAADTIQFEVPIQAQRCADGRGILVTGARQGQGVLVWLRADRTVPDTGTYPLLARADSGAVRGVIATVRFVIGPVTHGLTVDDGSATVTQSAPSYTLQVRGHGVEAGLGGPHSAELTLDRVPLTADTVSCQVQP